MKTLRFPGWYCDARPDGLYAGLVTDTHIQTDKGIIPLPGENVLQLRLAKDGRIAGHGHWSGQTQLYSNGTWSQTGPVISQDSHVWDGKDRLLACRAVDQSASDPTLTKLWYRYEKDGSVTVVKLDTGSIGIRQILETGEIIPAWTSYADPHRGLWCFTDYSDVAIGQGAKSGCIARFAGDGILRLIEPGNCQFVRVNRDGNNWSVAIWRLDTRESVFYWMTTEELKNLPAVVVEVPIPSVEPDPIPVPEPEPHTPTDPPNPNEPEPETLRVYFTLHDIHNQLVNSLK